MAFTGQILKSYSSPGGVIRQIYHDGRNLWAVSQLNQRLYLLKPDDGTVLKEWVTPAGSGGAFFGIGERGKEKAFIFSTWNNGNVFVFDPAIGTFELIGTVPNTFIAGAWVKGNIFAAIDGGGEPNPIYYWEYPNLTLVHQENGLNSRRGAFHDGYKLYSYSINDQDIKVWNNMTAELIREFSLVGTTYGQQGIAFDGRHIYATQNQGNLIHIIG